VALRHDGMNGMSKYRWQAGLAESDRDQPLSDLNCQCARLTKLA
jgi:hypothetical protein